MYMTYIPNALPAEAKLSELPETRPAESACGATAPRLDAACRMLSESASPTSFTASDPPPVQLVGASASFAAVADVLWGALPEDPTGCGPEADEEAAEDPVTLRARNRPLQVTSKMR